MATETQDAQRKTEASSVVPEKSPFSGDAMDKFAEQLGLFEDEPKAPAKAKASKAEPCENCPDGETEPQPVKEPGKTAKETRQPFKVLKNSSGKEIPVYSQEEYDALALKGASGQTESQAAPLPNEVDERLQNALLQLDRIESYAKAEVPGQKAQQPTQGEDEIDLETIDDPAVRQEVKTLKNQVADLRKQADSTKVADLQVKLKQVRGALDAVFENARKEAPFEDIRLEENGPNLSEDLFAGLMQRKVAKDKLEGKSLRKIEEYIRDSVSDLNRIEKYYRGKYTSEPAKIDTNAIRSKYPRLAEEIGQQAVAEYLKKSEEAPPIAKSRSEDLLHGRSTGGDKGRFKGLDDALERALSDSEISDALEEAKRKTKGF